MRITSSFLTYFYIFITFIATSSCSDNRSSITNNDESVHNAVKPLEELVSSEDTIKKIPPPIPEPRDSKPIPDTPLSLESEYQEMLDPILSFKESDPHLYWFIVSWLKTNYNTPKWKGYNEPDWQQKTKARGIDCSGFARVMQDKIFGYKIAGSSRGILKKYCDTIDRADIQLGDLVFFRAPYSDSDRITHIGIYLSNNHFVHATSSKSAAIGQGLRIDSLGSNIWNDDLVAVGRIKDEYKKDR